MPEVRCTEVKGARQERQKIEQKMISPQRHGEHRESVLS